MKYQFITDWIKDYADQHKIESLVVGVSGGIDSAVTSTLAARTGLPTYCILLPILQHESHTQRGEDHIKYLKKNYPNVIRLKFDLTNTYHTFVDTVNPYINSLSLANTRARLRMTSLYQIASMHNGIVVGTGNKVEDFGVGFYTKYGDGGVDISPIADLFKSEVYDAGRELGIIDSIMTAPPTDGLWGDNRTDEDQIGATYDELEWAMKYKEENYSNLSKRKLEVLELFRKLNNNNSHKMEPIPVCVNQLKTNN